MLQSIQSSQNVIIDSRRPSAHYNHHRMLQSSRIDPRIDARIDPRRPSAHQSVESPDAWVDILADHRRTTDSRIWLTIAPSHHYYCCHTAPCTRNVVVVVQYCYSLSRPWCGATGDPFTASPQRLWHLRCVQQLLLPIRTRCNAKPIADYGLRLYNDYIMIIGGGGGGGGGGTPNRLPIMGSDYTTIV